MPYQPKVCPALWPRTGPDESGCPDDDAVQGYSPSVRNRIASSRCFGQAGYQGVGRVWQRPASPYDRCV